MRELRATSHKERKNRDGSGEIGTERDSTDEEMLVWATQNPLADINLHRVDLSWHEL
jgi:hypothetical protein